MADQEFKLLITGDASGAVAATQQAGAATQKLKIDATDLNDETRRMLGISNAAGDGAKKLGEEAAKTGEKMGESRREMREMGNELGRMVGVGGAGRAMLGGMGLAVFALAESLELLKGAWDEVQENIHGHIDFDIKPEAAAQITAVATAYETLATAMKKAREAQNSPEAAAARDISQLQTKLKLLQDILKAEEQGELANLAIQKDRMSPEAYAAAEQQIKNAFSGKETAANFGEKQAEIDRKKKEADELEAKSAREKALGLDTANRAGTTSEAEKNADAAKKSIDEIEAQIEWVKQLHLQVTGQADLPQYQGTLGKIQEGKDLLKFGRMTGRDGTLESVLAGLELQLAQAKSSIALGIKATSQADAGKEAISNATKDQASAEQIRQEAAVEQARLDAERKNAGITKAIGEGAGALGQMYAAENNNTPQGAIDAQAAVNAALRSKADLTIALQGITDIHSESYAAILTMLTNVTTELQKLSRRVSQMHFSTK